MIHNSKLFTAIMVSSIVLAVTACDDNANNAVSADVCQGITCSDHGICFADENGSASCFCDSGYHNSSTNPIVCEPDNPANPCNGIDCSGHGTCAADANGNAACTCAQGFHNASTNPLVCEGNDPVNPCNGVDCSGHGTCTADANDSAACTCAQGYHNAAANPLACESDNPADPCNGQNCSGHGTCAADTNGIAVCTCAQGYHNASDNVLACEADDPQKNPCDGIDCSGHGKCAADKDGKALCSCENGYTNETPTTCVKPEIDKNHNYMIDTYETASDQGVDCVEKHNAGCSDFCDSFIDYKCSTKCTSDSQCISNDYFCRSDGRCAPKVFETVWEVKKDNGLVKFPGGYQDCKYTIDWGDGSKNSYDSCDGSYRSHQYEKAGTYHIKLTGSIINWKCEYYGTENGTNAHRLYLCGEIDSLGQNISESYLTEVKSFGPVGLGIRAFEEAIALKSVSTIDIPNSQLLTTMFAMFHNCNNFNSPIENWDTSNVEIMTAAFHTDSLNQSKYPSLFNQPIGKWDTSNVGDMNEMFLGAESFNQPLENWDTSNVTNMTSMFQDAKAFNQPLEKWDISNVEAMLDMFHGAKAFNQPLNNWKTTSLKKISSMFYGASAFDQPLDKWDISKLEYYKRTFKDSGLSETNWNLMKANNPGWAGLIEYDLWN